MQTILSEKMNKNRGTVEICAYMKFYIFILAIILFVLSFNAIKIMRFFEPRRVIFFYIIKQTGNSAKFP